MKQTMHCVSSRSDMDIEMLNLLKGFMAILCILEADLDVDSQASLIIESKETLSISHNLEEFFQNFCPVEYHRFPRVQLQCTFCSFMLPVPAAGCIVTL